MGLPTAVALLALLISLFAVATCFAMYTRLRTLERTALTPGTAMLVSEERVVPRGLWPLPPHPRTLVLVLDGACSICRGLAETVAGTAFGTEPPRVLAVFSTDAARESIAGLGLDSVADADLWTAVYEGYAPCVVVIGPDGRVQDRRFVYGDTDVPALLGELLPAEPISPSISGSSHAS